MNTDISKSENKRMCSMSLQCTGLANSFELTKENLLRNTAESESEYKRK